MTLVRDLPGLAAREHDLVVVGGGISGAAIAWEAAHRGLRAALVEALDFGAGASWNSLKTIHGGLRHLQRADLPALRESMRERRALMRIAPGLVQPLGFLAPARSLRERLTLRAGLAVNDLLTPDRNAGLEGEVWIAPAQGLSADAVRARVPGLAGVDLSGGVLWQDAQVQSSERLLLAFLHAAAGAGALVANQAPALGLLRAGGRVAGVRVRDLVAGREHEVRAPVVVDAAGAGFAPLLRAAGASPPEVPWLRAINLVFRCPPPAPVGVGGRHGGRYLFLVPWQGRTLLGTAYGPVREDARAQAAAFLAEGRAAFPWFPLRAEDVALVHQGLVPGDERGLRTRSRVHEGARHGTPGLLTVEAVKYTTARATAEEVVDRVAARLRRGGPSRSARTPLPEVRPLLGDLAARTRHAVAAEMALHLTDAVLRRLDLGTAGPPAPSEAEVVEETMAAALGWDPGRRAEERASLARTYWTP